MSPYSIIFHHLHELGTGKRNISAILVLDLSFAEGVVIFANSLPVVVIVLEILLEKLLHEEVNTLDLSVTLVRSQSRCFEIYNIIHYRLIIQLTKNNGI